jgi:NAD(P)-dependent dehydrogenase (short-subunit alcohol dehydrogenase family)
MAPGAIETTTTSSQTSPSTSQIPTLFSLTNQTITITGGARGLGLTLAFAVVEAGGHAALLDLLPSPCEPEFSNLSAIAKKNGTTVSYNTCDVTSEVEITRILDEIEANGVQRGAPLCGMIACAGIQQRVPAMEYEAADFEHIMRVNVVGAFTSVKRTACILKEKKRKGSIVLIASMSGQIANRVCGCSKKAKIEY